MAPAKKTTAAKSAAKSASAKSSKGDGMDPASVSRMLGILKYKASEKTNKSGENLQEANAALQVYATLNSELKKKFLMDFETNGRGKGKQSLKFAASYEHTLTHDNTVEVGTKEDFLTMAQILELNGLRWHDFKDPNEAKGIAMSIIEGNKKEYGNDKPPIVHDTFPDIISNFLLA